MCVFFRKYKCGVDVLHKGCGGSHVQVYVGCRVFEVVKSYLCVSVPVLDDDCGAFVRFVYDDSIMDDMLFQGLCFIVWLGFGGICNGMCASSIIEVFTMFMISMSILCFVRTSFSAVVSLLLMRLTIVSVVLGC